MRWRISFVRIVRSAPSTGGYVRLQVELRTMAHRRQKPLCGNGVRSGENKFGSHFRRR